MQMQNTNFKRVIHWLLLYLFTFSLTISCRSVYKLIPYEDDITYTEDYVTINKQKNFRAIKKLTRLIRREPSNLRAYSARGFCYIIINKYDEALLDYNKAIELAPTIRNYLNRGNLNRKLGNYKDAFNDIRMAELIDSTNVYVNQGYGRIYMDLGEYQKAITYLGKAIKEDKTGSTASFNFGNFSNIGKCYSRLHQYEKAIEYYDIANKLNPNYPPLYNDIGVTYINLNNYEKGIENYTKAINLDPKYYIPYYNRGIANFNYKYYDNAIMDFQNAEKLTDKKEILVIIYCNLSRLMFLIGEYKESISYGNKALLCEIPTNLSKFYNIAKYNMAISYLKLTNPKIAYELYFDCFSDDGLSNNPELIDQVCNDLIDHYKTGHDQDIVKDILLTIIKITEEDFTNRLK